MISALNLRPARRSLARTGLISSATCAAAPAWASMFHGDALDAVADGMSWFVICVVPLVLIALFWMVHVMPEKIAHKKHHPQTEAIHVLCLLSLVFGGLLWPLAWLWAYTKPSGYRMAYGTDKHERYYHEMGDKHGRGELIAEEIEHLRHDLDSMAARGTLPPRLRALRAQLGATAGSGAGVNLSGAAAAGDTAEGHA